MSDVGPSLPIGDVRFDGEFLRDSGLDVLTLSFVEIDPKDGLIDSCARRDFLSSFRDGGYSKVAAFRAGSIVTSTVVVSRLPILRT